MAVAYRYARNPSPNGTSAILSTAVTVYKVGTTTAVTLYADPTLTQTIANPVTTDTNGLAVFYTSGVDTVDLAWSGSTQMSGQPLSRVDPVNAPLSTTGGVAFAYDAPDLFALEGSPTGVYRSNIPRALAGTDLAAFTTNTMLSTAIYLPAGTVVTNLTFVTGVTPSAGPTHSFAALYSNAATPALLAQSADGTSSVAFAAETAYTMALSAPQTITTSGIYYAALSVTDGTTMPTLAGVGRAGAGASKVVITGNKQISQTSGSALNGVAPATITGSTASGKVPLVIVT